MKNKGYIYLITCLINGKNYVGQTRKFKKNGTKIGIDGRWKQHIYNAAKFRDDCPKLNRAIRKYNSENFMVEKLISCSLDELNYYEEHFIDKFDSIDQGYNCTMGGDYPQFTEDQRKEINHKISIKAKKRWSSEKFKKNISKKISETNKTIMWKTEIRNNMLSALKENRTAPYLPSNIYERKINGILVGYEVKIKVHNKLIRKWFSSKKFTPEENLENAKKCLKEILESFKVITV